MRIKDWSTSPPQNQDIPDGFPENMPPSLVNDRARQVMAGVREWYEDPCWTDLGHPVTRVSDSTFRVTGLDVTSLYQPGRRVKLVGDQTNYGTIASALVSNGTVVTLSQGAVPQSLSSVALSIINPLFPPFWRFRGMSLTKVANQTLPHDEWVTLTWSGTSFGGFELISNRVQIPPDVSYVRASVRVTFAENSTGRRFLRVTTDGDVSASLEGTRQDGDDRVLIYDTGVIPSTGIDDLRVQARQTSGSSLDVLGGQNYINAAFTVEAVA